MPSTSAQPPHPSAQTQASPRRAWLSLPGRDDLVDAGFLVALLVIALVGFRTTYDGQGYLLAGLVGVLLGLLIAYVSVGLRQAWLSVVAMAAAVFFLLGGAIALRGDPTGTSLPTLTTLRALAAASVHGWKQLLTTLPPVDSHGPLGVIPYILGLIGGAGGYTLARRVTRPVVAVLGPLGVLVVVILMGSQVPSARLLQGIGFSVLALAWISARSQRLRPPVSNGSGRTVRATTGLALLASCGLISVAVAPHLPGATSHSRTVLRNYVAPPFDINNFSSPLVAYRQYTERSGLPRYKSTLLSVQGLPNGYLLRFATLDSYDGSVWGATNGTLPTEPGAPADSFQRVGTKIATDAHGKQATVTVTVKDPQYGTYTDLDHWLPVAGTPNSIAFAGADAASLKDQLRYNLYTGTGIDTTKLNAGDHYTFTTTLDTVLDLPASGAPFGTPSLSPDASDFTGTSADKWAGSAQDILVRLRNIAGMLQKGKYSDDGQNSGARPGHSVGNLTSFLNGAELVGTDEQYSAAFALMANHLGIPARVVLGAAVNQGLVKGSDVHAWVEVHLSTGWVTIQTKDFTPNPETQPTQQPPQNAQDANAAVVPPPNPVRPPSSLDELSQAESNSLRNNTVKPPVARGGGWHLPRFVVAAIRWGGPPLIVIALICGLILGAKGLRRRRRRTRGPASTRVMHGWHELLDYARDLGLNVPIGATRREIAAALPQHSFEPLARSADRVIFGPTPPDEPTAAEYWDQVVAMRRAMASQVSRWRRLRAALSLRSFSPRRSRTAT